MQKLHESHQIKQNNIQKSEDQTQSKIQFNEQIKNHIQKLIHKKYGNNSFQSTQISFSYVRVYSQGLIYALRQSSTLTNKKFINPSIVKRLDLSGNGIGDIGIQQLCRKKYHWTGLKSLCLFVNRITMKGVQHLSRAAQMKLFPKLQELWLSDNKIGSNQNLIEPNQQKQSINEGLLLKFADHNTKLNYLVLFRNNINDYDMIKLFSSQKENNQKGIFFYLQQIKLEQNKITKCQMKTFAHREFAQQYPSLRILHLNHNKINKNGIKQLFGFINSIQKNKKISSKLQQLYLYQNNLCSQAIKILASNKTAFNNLNRLWVHRNNFIGDQGIAYLMKSCQQGAFYSLQRLFINSFNLSNLIQTIMRKLNPTKLKFLFKIYIYTSQKLINEKQIKKKLFKRFNSKVQFQFQKTQKENED